MWIARDIDGDLKAFNEKPKSVAGIFVAQQMDEFLFIDKKLYPEIKYSNSPVEIIMYFPKEQSNHITNLVAELNSQLGNQYFSVGFDGKFYTLNPTNLAVSKKKYNYISVDGKLSYSDMFNYISGILTGIRAAKEKCDYKS